MLGLEAVLLALYNSEVLRREGAELKWTPPSLEVPSVFSPVKVLLVELDLFCVWTTLFNLWTLS